MCGDQVPGTDAFRANLAVDMPWPKKAWLVALNTSRKLFRLKTCCGHHGEPGC